jgi:stress response protein YsnF
MNSSGMTGNPVSRSQHVTAFFDNRSDAEAAVRRLVNEGVRRDEIRMVEGAEGTSTGAKGPEEEKGFWASLADFFMPDEDRHTYAEGLSRGGYMLSVNTTSGNRDRTLEILDQEGTINIDERAESWRAEGWSGYQPGPATARTPADSAADKIDVVQEELRVGKREVDHGRVRVRSYIAETPVQEDVTLRDKTVHVERKAVDRPVSGGGDAAFAERTVEAEETHEEAVVNKEAKVTEEITLRQDAEEHTETVKDSVRHTEVDVDDSRTNKS